MSNLASYFEILPKMASRHSPSDNLYSHIRSAAKVEFRVAYGEGGAGSGVLSEIGVVNLPYYNMGAVDSVDLFGLDELVLFSYYLKNRDRYRNVADIGANIGLHSIVLGRLGYNVRAYEPDPSHFKKLEENLKCNNIMSVEVFQVAVSASDGEKEFVRVKGNTTGSHLAGAKSHPYGELDRFSVLVKGFKEILNWADLLKLDVEGHEADIICSVSAASWGDKDAFIEVGSEENATKIFQHFYGSRINLFAQKNNWQKVVNATQLPVSYKEGALFVSSKSLVPWT